MANKKYLTDEARKAAIRASADKFKAKSKDDPTLAVRRRELSLARRVKNPIDSMLKNARSRARRKNIEFSLVKEDVILPEYCCITGLKLEFAHGKGKPTLSSYTLDRIDNTKGYTIDNIGVISRLANLLKNSMTLEQIDNLHRYVHG